MTIARRGVGLLAAAAALIVVPLGLLPVAAQAAPTHVAIVVAGNGSACVAWHSGMSGADVLTAARYHVTWGQQPPYVGFVLQIDGRGAQRPDDEHYWSYWHNTGGGWSYSGRGAASGQVQPGTVEGWSYVDGQSSATAPPAKRYADVCAGRDSSPAPTRHPSTHPHRPSTSAAHPRQSTRAPTRPPATRRHSTARTPTASATAAATRTRATAAPTSRPPATRSATHSSAPTTARPDPTAASRAAPSGAVAAAASAGATPHAESDRSAALPSWTTALALLIVAAIGATALVRVRRSSR